jgi:putative zinc finger/helix-turn-helix YgiT family protein
MTNKRGPNKARLAGRDRPFPWRCPNCLKLEVRLETFPRTVSVNHDGRVHELQIPELRAPRCGACGEILIDNQVDEQVNAALRSRVGLLSPEDIQSRREALGVSRKDLALVVPTTEESLSRWEAGAQIQSKAMDELLHRAFDLLLARGESNCAGENQSPHPIVR